MLCLCCHVTKYGISYFCFCLKVSSCLLSFLLYFSVVENLEVILFSFKILFFFSVSKTTGLGSILFAITVDRPELNKAYSSPNSVHVQSSIDSVDETQKQDEPKPVISESVSPASSM